MSIQELPDELLCKIAAKVAKEYWWQVGPLLRAEKRWGAIVFHKEVLKDANIFSMCSDPADFSMDGRKWGIFTAYLAAGNTTTNYYEGLRLVAQGGDIEGVINLLHRNVLMYDDATFAAGILSICAGNSDMGVMYLGMLANEQFGLRTKEVRRLVEELIREIRLYSPPYKNMYKTSFKFHETELITTLDCAPHCDLEYGPTYNLCNNCYLWWCAVRVCNIL